MKIFSILFLGFVLMACSNRMAPLSQNQLSGQQQPYGDDALMMPYPDYTNEEPVRKQTTGDHPTTVLTLPPFDPVTNTRPSRDEPTLPSIQDELVVRKITMHRDGDQGIHYILEPRVHADHFHYVLKVKTYQNQEKNLEIIFLETSALHLEIQSLFTGDTEVTASDASRHPQGATERVILYTMSDERAELIHPFSRGLYPEVFANIQVYLDEYFGNPSVLPKEIENDDPIEEGSVVTLGCEKFPSLEGTWQSIATRGTDYITTISRIQFERDSTLNPNRDVYLGEDETTTEGCFGTNTKRTAVTYKYNIKTCEVVQKKNGQSDTYKVHSVETKKDGKRVVRFRTKSGNIFKIEEI